MMKTALAALALALSATIAVAQDSGQLTPQQQRLRDYFKPGGQLEKDNPGIRQRAHDAEMRGRVRRGRPPTIDDATAPRDDPRPGPS
jgi:hypothetical protein